MLVAIPPEAAQLPVGGNWIDFSQVEIVYPVTGIVPVPHWKMPMWSHPALARWEVEFVLIPYAARPPYQTRPIQVKIEALT